MIAARAGGDKCEIRDAVHQASFKNVRVLATLQDVVRLCGPRQILREPRRVGSAQDGVERRLAQVGVDKQNGIVLVARQAHGQI